MSPNYDEAADTAYPGRDGVEVVGEERGATCPTFQHAAPGQKGLAAIAKGWKDIDTQTFEGSGIDFEKAELAENLHRGELTKLERDQQLARYIRLCEKEQEVISPEGKKPAGGRPKGGINAAARELSLPRTSAQRAVDIETITAPAAAAITELGLANSPGASLGT